MLGPTPDPAGARFRIVAELGRGAVGAVYRAVEAESGREVALKVLLERPDPTRLARFAREGEVTAALDHPGIVRVHASGVLGGRPFLAYELVPGGETLADALATLDRSTRLRLLRDAAAAVGHAHARGVVHRDLKPSNVLIDRASGDVPRARVADFGMARLTGDSQDRLTRTGAMVGTPHYMAPEQAAGARDVGPPADVWALGVMLYEALVDRLPFDGETLQELVARLCAADPTPPRALDPALAPDLEAVVLRALAREPGERYPDAGALAADLDAFLRG
ncbi:MAG: serine/threonine protein kinase, partial [Planctomycetes bacterium]|nr:serine/threonine protein kinase [Planctomycetota bacterium]